MNKLSHANGTPLPPLRGGAIMSQSSPGLSRRHFLVGSGVVITGLTGAGVWLGWGPRPSTSGVLVLVEKTTRSPGMLAAQIRSRMLEIATVGGGQLAPYAGGERVFSLRPVSLTADQQGDTVNNPDLLAGIIGHRLDALSTDLARAPVGVHGFNLVAALKAIADASRPFDRLEAWLQTIVLSSSADPLRLSALLAAEPKAAVAQVMTTSLAKLDLSRVELHPVLVTPVGDDQPPLSVRADQWREDFLTQLTTALGAQVVPPVRDTATAAAWLGSATAPAIITQEDSTPTVPGRPPDAVGQPSVEIDTAAFKPDSAELLTPALVTPKVRQAAARYRAAAGSYPITCTGYCARFGDPAGARALSAARAAVIRQLLITEQHIPGGDAYAIGLGFDQRADPNADPQSPAQRVVLMQLVPRTP